MPRSAIRRAAMRPRTHSHGAAQGARSDGIHAAATAPGGLRQAERQAGVGQDGESTTRIADARGFPSSIHRRS